VAPAASLVRGRILRVDAYHTDPREVVIVLRPETVQVGDTRIALSALRDTTRSRRDGKIAIDLPAPGEDHAGLFRFAGDHVMVPVYFRSDWHTVP